MSARLGNVYHLPAYAAVGRWVAGRRVVVVEPSGPQGPSRLSAGGAGRVVVVGECAWAQGHLDVRRGVPELPLPDGEVDLVVCIEAYAGFTPTVRRQLLREAHRVLRRGGLFAAWVPREPVTPDDADFWALESELGEVFSGTTMVAQIPWQGVSLAPVLDDDAVPSVTLEETLLREAPEATHYLAVAFRERPETELLQRLRSECLLVPVPLLDAAATPIAPRVGELEAMVQSRDTDIRVLTGSIEALEASLTRASERADGQAKKLEALLQTTRELEEQYENLVEERDGLAHQVQFASAAHAGHQQLSDRVESELDHARARLMEQTEQLAERTAEASRLGGELQAVRERLTDQELALDKTRLRADELTRTAARQDEQGRMLSEVAADRDRLREELTRRAAAIHALEERMWSAREEVQKERLEVVRLTGEGERAREQAERARQVEQEGRLRVEAVNAEIRKVELERADALALLRSRDEEIMRLRNDAQTLGSEFGDVDRLRTQLAERSRELGEITAHLEQAKAREREAGDRLKRRDQQLSQAGADLERLRRRAEQSEGEAAGFHSELEVKALEVEQLAASVADLQGQIEQQRHSRRHSDVATTELQRRLELASEEIDQLRNRLRRSEQELADVVSAKETHGVELYRLRQELEAASTTNEQLEEALRHEPGMAPAPSSPAEIGWPDDAVAEKRRLRAQLEAQTRRHAEQLARIERERGPAGHEDDLLRRARAGQLEADVRADEQEHLLMLLEGAEQNIWELNDAADRNAARLAASLAQLEKHKEQIDEMIDELEVTRRQLTAAQARALEHERMAASERAKLVRAGIDPDGLPLSNTDHEDPFADMDAGELEIELHAVPDGKAPPEAGAPAAIVSDRQGSSASRAHVGGPRIVVESIDDDEWEGDAPDATQRMPRQSAVVAADAAAPASIFAEEPTMPRFRVPKALDDANAAEPKAEPDAPEPSTGKAKSGSSAT